MTLKGPEAQDQMSEGATPLPETKTGEMGNRQVVLYDPKVAYPFSIERVSQIFLETNAELFRRSLEADRYAAEHLRRYGEGKIFVLLGHSTAGKTSIIGQLRRDSPEWVESGMDMDFPSQDADELRRKAPALYERMARAMDHADIGRAVMGHAVAWKPGISKEIREDAQAALDDARKIGFDPPSLDADTVRRMEPVLYGRMAQALEHRDIARALFGHEAPRWKSGISEEELKDAQAALEEAKMKRDDFPLVNYEEEHERKMEETVIARAMRGESVIFDPYQEEPFLARMIEKNNFAPLKMGLAYCPFPALAERVRNRNIKAIAGGHVEDYRSPLSPLQQFCDFYKPAGPGDTVIDTLHREQVESAFESAFEQQKEFLLQRALERPPHPPLLPTADPAYSELVNSHDRMRDEIMKKLGFKPGVTEVKITTSRKSINYLFRTSVMQPPASAEVIREWK